ncbi:SH3 domain-containing protein [Asticcacaulis sp. EMRT-3]|uniref:SH3 domain-containing protein n=1 Tax=Asticcacaulis sp. EMRT-3 TaxID=3040349 RepID=UPI0024AF5179|nr:SH3 domain-containing protein [Asticcacaulis sp. EMRT-3]MDI7776190.1 SH3 domain-containing protein [Asticcacaulis sp. EMRT-3]
MSDPCYFPLKGSIKMACAHISRLLRAFQALRRFAQRFRGQSLRSLAVLLGLLSLGSVMLLSLEGCKVNTGDKTAYDTPSGLPVPRWVVLRAKKVNARNGPSLDNALLWAYQAPGLPVQVISETKDWVLVCDSQGGLAWVATRLVRNRRAVLTPAGVQLNLYAKPDAQSTVKAVLRPAALAELDTCNKNWCRISLDGVTGWTPQAHLWGTQSAPACQRPNLLSGLSVSQSSSTPQP